MEPTSVRPPEDPPSRTPAPWPGWYLLGGVGLIACAAVVLFAGERMRWGTAKGVTLAAVGLGQLAIAQVLRNAAREPGPAMTSARLSPLSWARLATTAAWIVWIVVWSVERFTR